MKQCYLVQQESLHSICMQPTSLRRLSCCTSWHGFASVQAQLIIVGRDQTDLGCLLARFCCWAWLRPTVQTVRAQEWRAWMTCTQVDPSTPSTWLTTQTPSLSCVSRRSRMDGEPTSCTMHRVSAASHCVMHCCASCMLCIIKVVRCIPA